APRDEVHLARRDVALRGERLRDQVEERVERDHAHEDERAGVEDAECAISERLADDAGLPADVREVGLGGKGFGHHSEVPTSRRDRELAPSTSTSPISASKSPIAVP